MFKFNKLIYIFIQIHFIYFFSLLLRNLKIGKILRNFFIIFDFSFILYTRKSNMRKLFSLGLVWNLKSTKEKNIEEKWKEEIFEGKYKIL